MGSLCSKHDRDDNELAPRPARAVSAADVAAQTTEMLERRATQRVTETVAVSVSTSPNVGRIDPPPSVVPVDAPPNAAPVVAPELPSQPQPTARGTIRMSRLQADVISDGLMAGSVDFTNVSNTVGTRQVIVDEPTNDVGATRRATTRRSHAEVSRSPTSPRTSHPMFGPRPEPWKSTEAKQEGTGGSSAPASAPAPTPTTPASTPKTESQARSDSFSRPYQELPSSPVESSPERKSDTFLHR